MGAEEEGDEEKSMDTYAQFTRRIGLIGLTNILNFLGTLLTLPILTKVLPIEEYGVWVQVVVTVSLIPLLVNLGLPYAMVRFLAVETDRRRIQEGLYSILSVSLLTGGLTAIVLFALAGPIASGIFGGMTDVARITALVVLVECINLVSYNYFRTFQKIRRYSILLFSQTYLLIALLAITVLSGYGIIGAMLSLLASRVVLLVVMLVLIARDIGFAVPAFSRLREYLGFGVPTIPSNLSSWIVSSSDRYMVGILVGIAFVGYYSPAYNLGNLIQMFIAPLAILLPAALSKLYDQGRLEEVRSHLRYSLKYFLVLAIPSAVGLSILSRQILEILSTSEIASEGYMVTPFIACSIVLFGVYVIVTNILVLEKRTRIIGGIWVGAAAANFVLNLLFIPRFGLLGAAYTTLIAYSMAFAIAVYFSSRSLRFNVDWATVGKALAATFVMGVAIYLIAPEGLPLVSLTVLLGIGLYFGLLVVMRTFSRREYGFFKRLIRNTFVRG